METFIIVSLAVAATVVSGNPIAGLVVVLLCRVLQRM